jgi:hypothetical protein
MPYEIILNHVPADVALSSAKKDENVSIATREFSSSEDGDIFIQLLEGLAGDFLQYIPDDRHIMPSLIDHMLVVIRRDETATIYINELGFHLQVRLKQSKKQGDTISLDDIINIESLTLENTTIPNDAGFLFNIAAGTVGFRR